MLITKVKDKIVIETIANLQIAQSEAADNGDAKAVIKVTKYLMRFVKKYANSVNAIWPTEERE